MIASIQTQRDGNFYNVNAFLAYEGFTRLGWETHRFADVAELAGNPDPELLVVGGIGSVRKRLEQIGRPKTGAEIDYPEELRSYLGRRVWTDTIGLIRRTTEGAGIFIKPRALTKSFDGKVVRGPADFIGFGLEDEALEVWCSEPVSFRTEWRCFVRYGTLYDVRPYKGAWDSRLDLSVVRAAIRDFGSAPAAYALDFGVDDAGVLRLVEVNDGHSLGSYGMGAIAYARFLSARWAEMAGVKDYADF